MVEASENVRQWIRSPLVPEDRLVIAAVLPTLMQQREAAGVDGEARAMLRLDEGKVDEAWEDLFACTVWQGSWGGGRRWSTPSVAIAMDGMACAEATGHVWSTPGPRLRRSPACGPISSQLPPPAQVGRKDRTVARAIHVL